MVKGIIVNNGTSLDNSYTHKITFADYYKGSIAINPIATLVTGGSLDGSQAYFYQVTALTDRYITITGDAANQLSLLDINCLAEQRLFWQLTSVSGVLTFTLASDPNGQYLVAQGHRTGDGVILFNALNDNKISGTVTVAYSADIYFTDTHYVDIAKNVEIGYEEVTATTTTDKTITLSWDKITGVTEYRIYRGKTTGIYDGYFSTTVNGTVGSPFVDNGAAKLKYDWQLNEANIIGVSKTFSAERYINGVLVPTVSRVSIMLKDRMPFMLDLQKVKNQPTWNTGTASATEQALIDISSWIA